MSAEQIARDAHRLQTDLAGRPYIAHVERVVANLLRRWPDATADEIAAAWLHDVIEDSGWSADHLCKAGVSSGAVAIVQEVTRPEGTKYLAWIQHLSAHGSLSAVRVKIADNEDNSLPERVASIQNGDSMLRSRYLPARKMLEARMASELAEVAETLGGTVTPIVLSDEEKAALERHLAFVEKHGHQP